MRIKLSVKFYYCLYFLILMGLFHYKIKTYSYWRHIANLQDTVWGFSNIRFLIAGVIFLVNLKMLLKIDKEKMIFTVLSVFFILLTIPSLISFTSGIIYPTKLLFYHQLFFAGLFLSSRIKFNLEKIPRVNKTQSLYFLVSITSIGIIPYLINYGPYINLNNLLLQDIYETREVMGKIGNAYFGYSSALFSKIIIPLIIVFSLELKKWGFMLLGVLYLVLFYLFGAHKTVYLGLIVVFVFYKLNYFTIVIKTLKWSSVLIIFSAVLAYFSFDHLWILIFRRVHFIPALLDVCYIDFFKNQPIYWSESILKSIFTYPFDMNHTNLIGGNYFNSYKMSANNGLISDGFMNLGTVGVLINIFIVTIYFAVLNNLKIPPKYFGLYLLIVFSFSSASTFTALLTHGAIALLLISIFMLNEKKV